MRLHSKNKMKGALKPFTGFDRCDTEELGHVPSCSFNLPNQLTLNLGFFKYKMMLLVYLKEYKLR
jgi:hypothetical protein